MSQVWLESTGGGRGDPMSERVRLAYVTTIADAQWALLQGQNQYLVEKGFELHAIASPGRKLTMVAERDGAIPHPVAISRTISPVADCVALIRLFLLFRRIRPHIAHVSTPKAALLGSAAGWAARVPVRVFCFRGSITEPASGMRRRLYRWLERLTAQWCHQTICVSHSLRAFARSESILARGQGMVPSNGMSNGIDVQRFDPDSGDASWLAALPERLAALSRSSDAVVLGYVGRLARDKGIEELTTAWTSIRGQFDNAHLLLVGPWEAANAVPAWCRSVLEADPRVHLTGGVGDVIPYLRMMTIFVFASWGSEGFPNAPMEAAAMRLPVIATRVLGCTDAVEEGVTGTLVPARDPVALAAAIQKYIDDSGLRRRHGQAGRERVLQHYRREAIWDALYLEYTRLLREERQPVPRPLSIPDRTSTRNPRIVPG